MSKIKEVEFNIKNVKFAVREASGSYGEVQDLAYAEGINLESTYASEAVYGDGEVIAEITSDKGLTGSLTTVQNSDDYEIAMGRKLLVDGGLIADVTQKDSVEHAIYFETSKLINGVTRTKKVWLFNVTSGKASETNTQSKESVSLNNFEIPLTIRGEKMMANDGLSIYKDEHGNTMNVTKLSAESNAASYATFEDEVPTPKMAAE